MDANTTIIHEDELIEEVSPFPICNDVVLQICKVTEVLQEINRQVYVLDDLVYCLKDCSNLLKKKRHNLDANRNTVQKLFELDTARKDSEALDNLPGLMEQLEGGILEGNQLIHEESMSIDTQSDVLVAAVDSLNAIAKDLAAFTNRTARSPGHSKIIKAINEISEQEDVVNSILSPLRPKPRPLTTLGNRNNNSSNNISSNSSSNNNKSSTNGFFSSVVSYFNPKKAPPRTEHGRNTRSSTGRIKPKAYTEDNDADFDSEDEILKAMQLSKAETRREETVVFNSDDESVAEVQTRPPSSSNSSSKYAGNPSMAVLQMDQKLMRAKQTAELQEEEVDVTQEGALFDFDKDAPSTPWLSSRKAGSARKKIILSSQDEEGIASQQELHVESLPVVDVCSPSTSVDRVPVDMSPLLVKLDENDKLNFSPQVSTDVSDSANRLYSTNIHHTGRVGGWDGGPDFSTADQQETETEQGSVYCPNSSNLSVTDSSESDLETTKKKIPKKTMNTPAACKTNRCANGLSHSKPSSTHSKKENSALEIAAKHSSDLIDKNDLYFGTQMATPASKVDKKEASEIISRNRRQGTGTQSENDEEVEDRNTAAVVSATAAVSRYTMYSLQNTPLALQHSPERVDMSGSKRGSEVLDEHPGESSSTGRVLRSSQSPPIEQHVHSAAKKSRGENEDIGKTPPLPLGYSSSKLDKIAHSSHFPAAEAEKESTTAVSQSISGKTPVRSLSRNSNLAVQHQDVVDLTG